MATRRLLKSVLLVVIVGAADVAGAQQDFVSGFEDVPLMAGLVEDEESLIVFDKPAGRIVEARAIGPVSRAAAIDFYREALPPLGWTLKSATSGQAPAVLIFEQKGETLELKLGAAEEGTEVHFSLAPGVPTP